ncbi:MAG TPA: 4Fe-4S binding protein, partial [Firmicutes bacterium]|nr:4Fe-4S binding protein [Bacillota bacterium]
HRGSKAKVVPAFGKNMAEVECVNCGQCAAVCPTGAIVVKSEVDMAWKAISDPKKFVIAQIAPAVRVAVGEAFSLPPGEVATGKVVAAMRRMGFRQIFDTCFAADLTVMEEAHEFIKRLESGDHLPQFTSCCPAWVKFAEQFYPDMVSNLSSCRSPQQMFGSVAKGYYARELGIPPEDLYVVSVMPCTAKKFEAKRPEFSPSGVPDVDLVLTTQEIIHMIEESGISFESVEPEAFDVPFGFASGAGVIFGATGGVAEAVLRAAAGSAGQNGASGALEYREAVQVNFNQVRGMAGFREACVKVGDREVRLAVVNGLGNARSLLEAIKRGEARYDLVEVMACPGGCVGGAGQPVASGAGVREARAKGLYRVDRSGPIRRSQDNPFIASVYAKWLDQPGSHKAHEALHTSYCPRRRIAGEEIELLAGRCAKPVDVGVCVGTSCYLKGSYAVLKNLVDLVEASGLADRVNLHAAFCFENCDKGPSVSVDGELISGVTPERAAWIFETLIKPRALGQAEHDAAPARRD